MSTHLVGIIPPDEKWKKMLAIYQSCKELDIDPPVAVREFLRLDDGEPDPKGVIIDLTPSRQNPAVPTRAWHDEAGSQGFEIEVANIPENVKILRFYNNW